MKTRREIESALKNVDVENPQFHNMTYEQGVEEALMWVLTEIDDDEFEYSKDD